jgi:hypothetical protein
MEVQGLVVELGRQRVGAEAPDAVIEQSCRLDIVGLTLSSVVAEIEPSLDTDEQPNRIGRGAMELVCRSLVAIRNPETHRSELPGPDVADRIQRMGELLDRGYTSIEARYVRDDSEIVGVLDRDIHARLVADAAGAAVEGVTTRSVLFGLRDRPSQTHEKQTFGGDLIDEAGQHWAVRFDERQVDLARELWRRNVELTGRARYSRTRRPLLHVEAGRVVEHGDWEQALNKARGAWKELYRGEDFERVVSDLR